MQVLDNWKTRVRDCGATAARRAAGTYGPPAACLRAWTTLALLAISMVGSPAAAQDDCAYPEDWDDIPMVPALP